MPRKKDGMLYEVLPRPTNGADGKPLLYVRPAQKFKYNIDSIDDFCHKYRGMISGEMRRLFTMFLDVGTWLMHDGSRIETPIGSFAPKLKLSGDFTDPKQIKSKDVSLATIEFIPSKEFVSAMEKYLDTGFREKYDVLQRKPIHELRQSGAIEAALQELCANRNSFGVDHFVALTGMKYNTAREFLNNLCQGEHPRLRRYKYGNKLCYRDASKE
ncbi:MAG: hypothetical protein J6I31_05840 [Prevotella sp.]|nr:hypothetical protein [Prevotella sp.]